MMQHRNNMTLKKEIISAIFVLVLATLANAKQSRIKRMYAMCPPHFQRIGSECYFISSDSVNWLDAHFQCKDRNSRLAEPYKFEDRLLRKYMQRVDKSRTDFWIGGIFNWQRNKWQWGYNGRDMKYQSFSQTSSGNAQDLKFHCAILNPQLKYRWSARSCVDRHNYICQHRMPYVNEKNRQKVYTKWNETYPNEMANEIVEVFDEDERLRNNRHGNRRPFNPNRQRKINERNRENMNSIQTQLDDRLENRVDVPRPRNPSNPKRRRMNRQRSRNGHGYKNEIQNSLFERQFNSSRFYAPRKPIDFDEQPTKALVNRRREHQKLHKNRVTTTTTTTTTSTTTIRPTTTTGSTQVDMPGTTTENIDDKYRAEEAEERYRLEEQQVDREESKIRNKEAYDKQMMEQEEKRIYEENERRTKHFKEMEERHKQLKIEQQKMADIEHLRQQKHRQNEERAHQNEQNHLFYEQEKLKQTELLRQRELDAQRNAQTTPLAPVLSNDVLDQQPTVASIQRQPKHLTEDKIRRRELLRKRIKNLSPEQQKVYLQRKLEHARKRGIAERAANEPVQQIN